MAFIITAVGIAGFIWAVMAARYNSVPLSVALFIVISSVFPGEFFGVDVGGLTVTLDRLWLLVVGFQCVYDYNRKKMRIPSLHWVDLSLGLFVTWLLIRTFSQSLDSQLPDQPPTIMHLLNGYLIPIFLYLAVRCYQFDTKKTLQMMYVFLGFGAYLSFTALAEVTGIRGVVWPSFINDPSLGIHFGRARGPFLQSVRLGICLNFVLAIVWLLPLLVGRTKRWTWVLAFASTPVILAAIFATYTRSIWLGTATVIFCLLFALLRGATRQLVLTSLIVMGLGAGVVIGPSLISFKREYSAAETEESTYMRAAFAYVSIQMFKDRPLTGFGFNQFQVYNRTYLDDRTTNIRLNSIRGYVHHNSFLSILVDLGLIGALLYILAAMARFGVLYQTWRFPNVSEQGRAVVALSVCVIFVHFFQMVFHEVSFSPLENSIVSISLGLSHAVYERFCMRGRRASDMQPTEEFADASLAPSHH